MFAVISIAGNQYKVSERETLFVPHLAGDVGSFLVFNRVLLFKDSAKVKVGKPEVTGMVVKAKIVSHEKGEKIQVRRFKSKVRYRRAKGFRPSLTKLEILSIGKA